MERIKSQCDGAVSRPVCPGHWKAGSHERRSVPSCIWPLWWAGLCRVWIPGLASGSYFSVSCLHAAERVYSGRSTDPGPCGLVSGSRRHWTVGWGGWWSKERRKARWASSLGQVQYWDDGIDALPTWCLVTWANSPTQWVGELLGEASGFFGSLVLMPLYSIGTS